MLTNAERIRALQAEARAEAKTLCGEFAAQLQNLADLSAQITTTGDAAPVGIRELASRLTGQLSAHAQTVQKLNG